MALTELPPEVLFHVVGFLPSESALCLEQSCLHLQSICDSPRVWEHFARRDYGVTMVSKSGFCPKQFYLKVLAKYGEHLGLWHRHLDHYGGLYHLYYHEHALHMIEWIPPFDHLPQDNLRVRAFFSIRLDEAQNVRFVPDIHQKWLEGTRLILSHSRPDSVQILVEGSMDLTLDPDAWRDELDKFMVLHTGHPYTRSLHELLTLKFISVFHNRTIHMFQRLVHLDPVDHGERVPIPPGMFKGTYGPHGIEIVSLMYTPSGEKCEFRGVKVTGDPNVPFNQITFCGDLQSFHWLTLPNQRTVEVIEEHEPQAVTAENSWRDHPHQPFRIPEQVTVRADIPGLNAARTRFPCRCQVAGHGFNHSSFIEGHFIVFSDDLFAVLFLELSSLSFFHRIKTKLDGRDFNPFLECERV